MHFNQILNKSLRINQIIVLVCCMLSSFHCTTVQDHIQKLEQEVLKVIEKWVGAWNGTIDKENMMDHHDERMIYYWRGQPKHYELFTQVLEEEIILNSSYNNFMYNTKETIINETSAMATINFEESGGEDASAISHTLTHSYKGWKIIHIIESGAERIPPNNLEDGFNKRALKLQEEYMKGNCETILPSLSKDIVLIVKGETRTFEMIHKFCDISGLPKKPVKKSIRNYKVLSEEIVYEYIDQRSAIIMVRRLAKFPLEFGNSKIKPGSSLI